MLAFCKQIARGNQQSIQIVQKVIENRLIEQSLNCLTGMVHYITLIEYNKVSLLGCYCNDLDNIFLNNEWNLETQKNYKKFK